MLEVATRGHCTSVKAGFAPSTGPHWWQVVGLGDHFDVQILYMLYSTHAVKHYNLYDYDLRAIGPPSHTYTVWRALRCQEDFWRLVGSAPHNNTPGCT